MTKKLAIFFIATTSLFMLSACDETKDNTSIESSTSSSETVTGDSSESTQSTENGYRSMYQASLAQFKNGKLDEAAGTIEIVLENDLSDDSELKTQATELKTKINTAQAEKVKSDETVALLENSAYKTERVSNLAATEFKEATGQDIKSASDDKIKTWLAEKEAAENSATASSVTSSTASSMASSESTVSNSSVSSSTVPAISTEEERIMVLEKIIALTGISARDNQFYSSKEDEKTYQVEVRHAHEVDGVEISNMVGMFKYDLLTETLMKMDPITGEYSVYTK
jgi:predicted glutamine amidotransferase